MIYVRCFMKRIKLLSVVLAALILTGCSKVYELYEYEKNGNGITITNYLGGNDSTTAIIPEVIDGKSIISIGDEAFGQCFHLKSITIPDSVITIGDYAFWCCSDLTSITIPSSVITIGDYAFWMCKDLTRITIPDSVITIGDYAFQNCDNLTSITIPDSVTSIGSHAFTGCSATLKINYKGETYNPYSFKEYIERL